MPDSQKPSATKNPRKNPSRLLPDSEVAFVREAYQFLEHPGFLIRAANAVGKPIQGIMRFLPQKHKDRIQNTTQKALQKGLVLMTASIKEMPVKDFAEASRSTQRIARLHSVAAFGTGAVGGFAGFASLPLELPVTTGIILRSISSIAADFGMDLNDPEVQLECLYVLSLGSPRSDADDSMESAYWASRAAFAQIVRDAARFISGRSSQQIVRELQKKTAPILIRFLSQVSLRFEGVVSQKVLAEMVPVVGAIGGGAVNAAFADYFSQAARYHFGLRSLESEHGVTLVRKIYERSREIEAQQALH
jgi:hypothetical protein